jgi:hypothetical protein
MLRRGLSAMVAGAVLALAPPGFAQIDDATRVAARELGEEGLVAYDAGKYAEAADKLGRAFDVIQVPALGLWLARALAQTGKLVEAYERYGEVTRLQLETGQKTEIQEKAQEDAENERTELRKRIPTVSVEVQGARSAEVEITVGAAKVPTALLGAPRPVNPGHLVVQGKRGDQIVTQEVTLAEGENRVVTLQFQQAAAPPPPPIPAATPVAPVPAPARTVPAATAAVPADQGTTPGSTQRTAGWIGLGIGGAGLAFGTVTGLLALRDRRNLVDGGCVDGHCFDDQDFGPYNSKVTLSTIGFFVGGVGLAAGAVLLLTAPSADTSKPEVTAWVGPGSAGLVGRFQ